MQKNLNTQEREENYFKMQKTFALKNETIAIEIK
jgi:hypothetical protein